MTMLDHCQASNGPGGEDSSGLAASATSTRLVHQQQQQHLPSQSHHHLHHHHHLQHSSGSGGAVNSSATYSMFRVHDNPQEDEDVFDDDLDSRAVRDVLANECEAIPKCGGPSSPNTASKLQRLVTPAASAASDLHLASHRFNLPSYGSHLKEELLEGAKNLALGVANEHHSHRNSGPPKLVEAVAIAAGAAAAVGAAAKLHQSHSRKPSSEKHQNLSLSVSPRHRRAHSGGEVELSAIHSCNDMDARTRHVETEHPGTTKKHAFVICKRNSSEWQPAEETSAHRITCEVPDCSCAVRRCAKAGSKAVACGAATLAAGAMVCTEGAVALKDSRIVKCATHKSKCRHHRAPSGSEELRARASVPNVCGETKKTTVLRHRRGSSNNADYYPRVSDIRAAETIDLARRIGGSLQETPPQHHLTAKSIAKTVEVVELLRGATPATCEELKQMEDRLARAEHLQRGLEDQITHDRKALDDIEEALVQLQREEYKLQWKSEETEKRLATVEAIHQHRGQENISLLKDEAIRLRGLIAEIEKRVALEEEEERKRFIDEFNRIRELADRETQTIQATLTKIREERHHQMLKARDMRERLFDERRRLDILVDQHKNLVEQTARLRAILRQFGCGHCIRQIETTTATANATRRSSTKHHHRHHRSSTNNLPNEPRGNGMGGISASSNPLSQLVPPAAGIFQGLFRSSKAKQAACTSH